MKIEWLQIISKVAECGSLTQAAEKCNTSQPAASRMMVSAENELGVKLFKRDAQGKSLTLSKDGEAILPDINNILESYEGLLAKTSKSRRTIRLAVSNNTFGPSARTKIISAFFKEDPEAILKISTVQLNDLLNILLSGEADLIVFSWGYLKEEGPVEPFRGLPVRAVLLGDLPENLACSESSLPASVDEDGISMAAPKDLELIVSYDVKRSEARGSHRYLLFEACRRLGFEPKFRVVENAEDIRPLITLDGQANFLSSAPPGLREYPGLTYIPIKDCPYPVRYNAIYRSNNSNPHVQKLITTLKTFF